MNLRTRSPQGPRFWSGVGLSLGLVVLAADAAAAPCPSPLAQAEPRDPWQPPNRQLFGFSMGPDRAGIGPNGHGYAHVVPRPLRRRVSAFIANLEEPGTAIND